jgi:glutamine amidotransferase
MSSGIVVVDYGIGNVFSVCNALRQIGAEPELTGELSAIRSADRVILPGVGAFAHAMDALNSRGISDALRDFVATGRPFLGICIGMQVLMQRSTEFGLTDGLGFFEGTVDRIDATGPDGTVLRVPHIGWGEVVPAADVTAEAWKDSLVGGSGGNAREFYFVHSYHALPTRASDRHAVVNYGGNSVTAAVRRDNILGVQFHPERSGLAGLNLLQRFVSSG